MKLTPAQAKALVKGAPKMIEQLAKRAALATAHRSVTALKKASPVDMGVYRAAWKVTQGGGRVLAKVENRSPIAGVVEKGARPHPVSFEGQAAIKRWVLRKGIVKVTGRGGKQVTVTKRNVDRYEAEVDRVVAAIVWKLKTKGQKGLHLLEKQIPSSTKWFQQELEELLRKQGK